MMTRNPPACPALVAPGRDPLRGNGETILIVEDDLATRVALSDVLEMLGYRVLAASDGMAALALLEEHQDKIALVLSDMVMPRMGALALWVRLKIKYPWINMVVVTGWPLRGGGQRLLNQGIAAFIKKPFAVEEIAQVVHQVLRKGV